MITSISGTGSIWTQKCANGDKILNDCNWCVCEYSRYVCRNRPCNEVDMFGAFHGAYFVTRLQLKLLESNLNRSDPFTCALVTSCFQDWLVFISIYVFKFQLNVTKSALDEKEICHKSWVRGRADVWIYR